jgi:hypothetical protein
LPKKPKLAADEPGTNKPATDEPATNKPATDEPATDEPATDEPATDEPATNEPGTKEPATEPPILEPTDEPAITDPSIIEPRETSREDIYEQGTSKAIVRSAVITIIEVNETAVGIPTITHTNKVAILDEYFPKSPINSRPLPPLVRSYTPEALVVLPSISPNTISLEAAGVLNPDQGIGSCEISKLISNTESVELLSSYIDLSNLSSETDITDINLPDIVK